jgi:thioredoxin reductase (NADPH)
MEEALFLTRFASKVTLIHRREGFRASRIMLYRLTAHPKVALALNTVVDEVLGEEAVEGLRLRDTRTGIERVLPVSGLFVAIGYRPNTALFAGVLETDEKGYLVVHDETGSTIEGVFIAGDVNDHRYRQAVTAAGDGARAAIDAERWLEAQGISATVAATTG